MKKNIIFGTAVGAAAVFSAVCTLLFAADIMAAGDRVTSNGIALIVSAAAFAIADVISAVFCISGKMPNEKSVIYSVTRLFMIVFALNMRDKFGLFLPMAIINIIMYIASLLKDFRKFAARRSGNEVSK
ncbi:MAG: hypothetical protein MSJ26_00340 [Oscillospiraceae bacterium]|nr:hypothetical protein [Oscillospiraceae bacterium]